MLSRRSMLAGVSSLLVLPSLVRAQSSSPRFRLEIAQLTRTEVDSNWHVRARVTIHNDSGRVSHVLTGCGSVFNAVGGRLHLRGGQLARGMDLRVQLCSPAVPSPIPLPLGATSEMRTYVFENPPPRPNGLRFYVDGELDGAGYRSNTLRL